MVDEGVGACAESVEDGPIEALGRPNPVGETAIRPGLVGVILGLGRGDVFDPAWDSGGVSESLDRG